MNDPIKCNYIRMNFQVGFTSVMLYDFIKLFFEDSFEFNRLK
ncbi:MAG: hypothetical protein RIF36_20770 [Imperialibacter sp.]